MVPPLERYSRGNNPWTRSCFVFRPLRCFRPVFRYVFSFTDYIYISIEEEEVGSFYWWLLENSPGFRPITYIADNKSTCQKVFFFSISDDVECVLFYMQSDRSSGRTRPILMRNSLRLFLYALRNIPEIQYVI